MIERRARQDTYPSAIAWSAAPVFGVGAGCAAAMIQRFFAPVGVFPLAIGAIVGLAVGGVWAGRGGGSKQAIVISAALAGLLCVASWHTASYLIARRTFTEEQRKVQEAMFQLMPDPSYAPPVEKPTGIHAYLTLQWHHGRPLGPRNVAGWGLAAWWIGDAVLVLLGAVLAAAGVGKPYSRGATTSKTAADASAGDAPPGAVS